jgi:ABC-type lipoprotein release transport system permease subunit
MHGFIIFILGCFLGAFVGVALMCMLQINRINRYETKDKKDDEDEEKL